MMSQNTAYQLAPPDPLGGRQAFEAAVARVVEFYKTHGAVVLTETLHNPPEDWRLRLLSAAEKDRHEKFLFDRDRHLYLAAHSLKRMVLGGIVRRNPAELAFGVGASGRPFGLFGAWGGDFNLSHSGHRVAIAIVARGRVGVDIQEPGDRYADLLEKLRHPDEADTFRDKSDFLRMWTLKESVSKAIGTGLAENFETLCVKPAERGQGKYHCDGWTCRHTVCEEGYHLAVSSDVAQTPVTSVELAEFA